MFQNPNPPRCFETSFSGQTRFINSTDTLRFFPVFQDAQDSVEVLWIFINIYPFKLDFVSSMTFFFCTLFFAKPAIDSSGFSRLFWSTCDSLGCLWMFSRLSNFFFSFSFFILKFFFRTFFYNSLRVSEFFDDFSKKYFCFRSSFFFLFSYFFMESWRFVEMFEYSFGTPLRLLRFYWDYFHSSFS